MDPRRLTRPIKSRPVAILSLSRHLLLFLAPRDLRRLFSRVFEADGVASVVTLANTPREVEISFIPVQIVFPLPLSAFFLYSVHGPPPLSSIPASSESPRPQLATLFCTYYRMISFSHTVSSHTHTESMKLSLSYLPLLGTSFEPARSFEMPGIIMSMTLVEGFFEVGKPCSSNEVVSPLEAAARRLVSLWLWLCLVSTFSLIHFKPIATSDNFEIDPKASSSPPFSYL